MSDIDRTVTSVPRIESLHVRNYRVLRDVRLDSLTPLTVLIGPNGSGKSTVFDVFAFLAECFEHGLPTAWARRGGLSELRSRGADGPIVIELKYREDKDRPRITYHLEIDEPDGAPIVIHEVLRWRRGSHGQPFRVLDYQTGDGFAIATDGDQLESDEARTHQPLSSPDLLAVNALGQFKEHPRVAALRGFITGWYLSYLSVQRLRTTTDVGPQERLSATGDNLANVLQHLQQRKPERLAAIFRKLVERVPQLEQVTAEPMRDARLLVQLKDRPFDDPILAQFVSDGTLKLLACLIVLNEERPPPLIGLEEPENFVHPALLQALGEDCLVAATRTQLLVTTHAPSFLDGLSAKQVRVLRRQSDGFTASRTAADIDGIKEYLYGGGLLGDAWQQRMFEPPTRAGDAR